jgi:signal transduction histidine kinase
MDFQADIEAIDRIAAVPTILDVVCRVTGMGFAAVARVTEDRWICCAVKDDIAFGLKRGGELKVETTICNEIRQSREAVAIDHVAENPLYCGHHTPARYGFQSYISMPIMLKDGRFFGTLCAIDPRPARLNNPEIVGMFKLFAELIGTHLDAMDRVAASEALLLDERKTAELREQFIAVLGHDLRNPLASISSGVRLILKAKSAELAAELGGLMQSSVQRMARLIDNVMDLARGRLGGGLPLNLHDENLGPVLHQVMAETRTSHPDKPIEAEISVPDRVRCDAGRIAQLFSNLLGNAVTHGSAASPIGVRAVTQGGRFELSVTNAGPAIPDAARARLFQPFYRAAVRPAMEGLGLGLYIVSEIARAHGGAVNVESSASETRFTFSMPTA